MEKNIAVSPRSYLKTIGLIFAFWLIVFWLQRLSFIYFFREAFRGLSTIELASTFIHGFLLDLSAVCYLAVLPVFALSLQQLVRFSFFKTFLFIYTILLLPVIGFISVFDMGIYHDWRIHLNYRAINYLRFVNEAAAFSDPKVNRVLTVLMIIQLIAAIVLLFVFSGGQASVIPGVENREYPERFYTLQLFHFCLSEYAVAYNSFPSMKAAHTFLRQKF